MISCLTSVEPAERSGAKPERMLDSIASFFVPDIKYVVAKTP